MKFIATELPEVRLIEPQVWGDERGFFLESYHQKRFEEAGISNLWVQDNHSRSTRGTLRGLHYQQQFPQTKLCRVVVGEVLDVVVDIRPDSPRFGKCTSAILSAENKLQILVPKGFAHGFLVLSTHAEFLYKCDEFYHPEDERGVLWNDPDLAIDWNLANLQIEAPILSLKDQNLPSLRDVPRDELPILSYD